MVTTGTTVNRKNDAKTTECPLDDLGLLVECGATPPEESDLLLEVLLSDLKLEQFSAGLARDHVCFHVDSSVR
jgi:hypothetical protein